MIDDIRVKRGGNGYPGRVNLPMDELVSAARGAAAGVVATAVMSIVMEAGRHAASFRRQPPKLIIRTVLAGGPKRAVPAEGALAMAAHVGYGASCGALFALFTRRHRSAASALGVGYGLLLWFVSYAGWVPAAGVMASPERDDRGRQLTLIAGHVVYGGVLAAVLRRLRRAPLTPLPAGPWRTRAEGSLLRPVR